MVFRKLKSEPKGSWLSTVRRLPILTAIALKHGALPVGGRALKTVSTEGFEDLHWKVLGDSLAQFLQNAGPVLTKLGQILATRNDLLPDAVCTRLETLYSDQPAMSERERKRILKAAYPKGHPFKSLDPKPIAVGSVGQVHRGKLQDGSPVIVKMIRPGAGKLIHQDIETALTLVDAFFALAL
jgi:predicted unusual protein kinase regulating ubiquinone biosynthesis (AarF/ABC1/UbiB family)